MEDLLSVLGMILYLVILIVGAKNKKNKKAKKNTNKRTVRFDQAFEQAASALKEQVDRSLRETPPQAAARVQTPMAQREGEDPCHKEMLAPERASIQLTNATQEMMENAGEGVDPCHAGVSRADENEIEASPVYCSPIFDTEDREAFSRDVLRGVVMSEILKRPAIGTKRRA